MNILVFTNHYPLKDRESTATKAVHYFTKEWIKQGHSVIVVYNHIELMAFFKMKNKDRVTESYILDGVKVLYCPVNRYIPKSDYIFKYEVRKVSDTIIDFLVKQNFSPDKFVVHFCAEQWQIVESVRRSLNCIPIPIFHNCDVRYKNRIKKIVTASNKIGLRSDKIRKKVLSVIDKNIDTFQVFSGAPDHIFNTVQPNLIEDETSKKKLLYVGNLIPLKKVDVTIKALALLKGKYDYEFNIIGSGESEKYLKKLVKKCDLEDRVRFLPRMTRENVLEFMRTSDCFVMVSQPETLGIVYIEAMASGCFIIGSKGEGIDGIIVNHESGFLVQPGDIDSLAEALEHYFKLLPSKLDKILKKSSNQALSYKESIVACDYLNNL
jgi:glycosyltransferase involved in cell wall biosynthesis